MKTTVFLLRHGETDYNVKKRIQGTRLSNLTAKGKKEAKKLGEFFRNHPPDAVYSSPVKRALDTARIAFPGYRIQIEKGLREREFGIWEGKTWSEVEKKFSKEWLAYQQTRALDISGAEKTRRLRARAKKTFEKIVEQNRGKTIAVVGHGMFNKAFLAEVFDWDDRKMAKARQTNGAINELAAEKGKWKLVRFNAVDHLPLEPLHVREIKKEVQKRESKTDFKSHDFNHVKRVAIGAKWFAKLLRMDSREQELAYIAGLVHDLGRPKTEKVDHTESSVHLAHRMLSQFPISTHDHETILGLVNAHRGGGKDHLSQPVFLADKLWEQMGAYVIFRRGIFVKEVVDYKGWDLREAFIHQHRMRTKRFYPGIFPKRFRRLAQYQFQWAKEAGRAIEKRAPWMLELTQHCANNAEKRGKTIDGIIKSFRPSYKEGKRFQKEAVLYITGKRVKLFERLVKK